MRWLTPKRVATLVWISVGALVFALAAGVELAFWPEVTPPAEETGRVVVALMLLRWPAAIVALMVTSLFRIADKESALDPVHGEVSDRHAINQRVLSNTLEQFAMFAPALCALAVVADSPSTFRFLQMATSLFCGGRLLFWGGYHVSPNARGLGFNMTFSTSVASLVAAFVLHRGAR